MKIPYQIENIFNKAFKPQLITTIKIYKNDELLKRFFGKSIVGNFLQIPYVGWANNSANFQAGTGVFNSNTSVTDQGGSLRNLYTSSPCDMDANSAEDGYGIVVGTGTTAPTPSDIAVETLIPHGNGAGELEYAVQLATQGVQASGSNATLVLQRTFVNNSGGNVTVQEINLVVANSIYRFLIYRDLTGGDLIADGETYTVELTFQINT